MKCYNWQGGLLKRKCKQCGKLFYVKRSRVKKGNANYCNSSCALLSRKLVGKCNYMFGRTGEKAPAWKGGISFEPYCLKFNETFKKTIRDKFNNKCFICGKTKEQNGKNLCVHHCNYNKKCGCDTDKDCFFVPLCTSCHGKTNTNREFWREYFFGLLNENT